MKNYLIKRFIILIPTFFGITILVYIISTLAPGSPLDLLLGDSQVTAADIERKANELGLNEPVLIQYFHWLSGLLKGNFGISFRTNTPVLGMIMERLGPTLLLTVTATILSIFIAVPLGVMSAYKPYSLWDYISSGLAFIGTATPNFFVGLILIYIFAVNLGILPLGGMYDSSGMRHVSSLLKHLIMPVIVFSLQQVGSILRQTRGSVIEVLQEDFITMSRAKGLTEFEIILKHVLRNALIPVVTVISSMMPYIIGGAVVTEQIFSWPGLGSLMVQSINARDYPTIMGVATFIAIVVLLGNFIADLIYGALDPKISHNR